MGNLSQQKPNLFRGATPRYVRCYDNGGRSIDRYTVVFSGKRAKANYYPYLAMNAAPFHPQGFGQHGENSRGFIDRPTYGHLGKKIPFSELPADCQKLVLSDYNDIWKDEE